jgi:hypothetical protein
VGLRGSIIALVMLAALALAACGGGGKTSSSTPTAAAGAKVPPAFVAKVDAVCAKANARFATNGKFPFQNFDPLHPAPKLLPKVGAFFKPNVATEQMIQTQLRALGEPATGARQRNAIRALGIAAEAGAIRQVHAALTSDVTGFVATVNQAKRLHTRLDSEARAAGFTASSPCAKIF